METSKERLGVWGEEQKMLAGGQQRLLGRAEEGSGGGMKTR